MVTKGPIRESLSGKKSTMMAFARRGISNRVIKFPVVGT